MSNIFLKNLIQCFSTFKCLPITLPIQDADDKGKLETNRNFNNSLYALSVSAFTSKSHASDDLLFTTSSDDFSDEVDAADLSTVLASERFFFSSPGHSNSIIDSPETPPPLISGGIAVQTDSPDPFADFRQSMQEMVEAHESTDWDFLNNLLLCYLNLNPKHTHKYIVEAFSDLIVSLVSSDYR